MPIHGYPGNVITANPTEPSQTSASGVWTTEQQLINQSAGRWPPPYYLISRSLRFNSADSAYLNRTFGTATGTTKGTWSGWVKRGTLGTQQHIFSGSNYEFFEFQSTDKIRISNIDGNAYWITTQVFRDPSAWYHFVISWDSTLATATDRCKFWVNGVRVTQWDSQTTITQNTTFARWNVSGYGGSIGRFDFGGTWFLSAYQTEIYWIDGQALTPSSFGQTNASTGVWEPIAYTGTYGTNGFYLNFSDNSGTTSTTLGKDYSGNGNNWTPNNFSVTAGAGNDSMVDSPTAYGTDTGVGGEVRGNYATFNPLVYRYSVGHATETNGNLESAGSSGVAATYSFGTIDFSDGKFVAEATLLTSSTAYGFGVCNVANITNDVFTQNVEYLQNGSKTVNGSNTSYGASYTTNDVIRCEVDVSGQTVQFFKNGTSQGTITSVTFTTPITFYVRNFNGSKWAVNFGQRPFANTATSGFKALCTQNLPTPTIGATSTTQANDYFDVVLRTSAGSAGSSVTSLNFQPDFIWDKTRSITGGHYFEDAVRGVGKYLLSNSTAAEQTDNNYISAFTSNGFTIGNNDWAAGTTIVDWCWKANGAGSTNTAGTITSTVSANTTSGFSIVTYTGTGALGTVGHSLGVTPKMIIVKRRNSTGDWAVYNSNLGSSPENNQLLLNSTAAAPGSSTFWGNQPSSSVFSVWTSATTNASGGTFVAYCFAPVAGYSAFGSYTGNGSSDGPFVYLGFRPEFVFWKNASTTSDWQMKDAARSTYNVTSANLYANLSTAENSAGDVDFLSNGFKLRSAGTDVNGSGNTIIYAAFAESPFKFSLAR